MKMVVIKRTLLLENGELDVSFVPAWPSDVRKAHKAPKNQPIEFDMKVKRDPISNSKLWALCTYFVHNLPERFYRQDEETGETVPCFSSANQLYKWLAHQVGWVDVISTPGEIPVQFVKDTDFGNLDDEMVYREEFHDPAIALLARLSDMTEGEMVQASIAWRKEITERKRW